MFFFVISGYLITSIIIKKVSSGEFSFKDFYERRARRILPPLIATFIISIFLAYLLMMPSPIKNFAQSLISSIFFVSNFLFYFESDYFDQSVKIKPLIHLWSLSIEEQFYIIFPGLILFLKRKRISIFGISLLLTIISFIAYLSYSTKDSTAVFYLSHFRFWEILCGSLLAIYLFEKKIILSSWKLSSIGNLLIIFSLFKFLPNELNLITVIFGSILSIAFGSHNQNLLSQKFLVNIGLISYGLYLYHQPLFAFYRIYKNSEIGLDEGIFLVIVSFIIAYISFRFLEKPIRAK